MLKNLLTKPWPALIWTGLIFFLLTIPTGTMESVPLLGIPNLDKLVHVILFGVFVWLWCKYLVRENKPVIIFFIALAAIIYGVGMEFYQDRFTTRAFELADIFADAVGAITGAIYFGKKISPYGNRGRNQN